MAGVAVVTRPRRLRRAFSREDVPTPSRRTLEVARGADGECSDVNRDDREDACSFWSTGDLGDGQRLCFYKQ